MSNHEILKGGLMPVFYAANKTRDDLYSDRNSKKPRSEKTS